MFLSRSLYATLTLVLLVTSCRSAGVPPADRGAATPAFSKQAYERIPADAGRVYWIDAGASDVRFFLWRGGLLAEKGHNHVMVVRDLRGAVFLPQQWTEDRARFDIVFDAGDIQVDPPALRQSLGGAFAGRIDAEGVQGTRKNMLGEDVLDAARYPEIGLSSQMQYGEPPKLVFETRVTLHGVQRSYLVPVTLKVQNGRLTARGAFAIRQSHFGIEPFSALGGALYVQDPIAVEFEIVARTR